MHTQHIIMLRRLLLALTIGAAGGFVFSWLRLPLAWMLGPMSFNLIASLARLPVAVPTRLRTVILPIVGIYLGSAFSPEFGEQIGRWPWSLAGVLLFTIGMTLLSQYYYRKIAGFDPLTALFSATPGGLSMMVVYGAEAGADERRIALSQSLRVVIVVFLIPPLVLGWAPPVGLPGTPPVAFDAAQMLLLLSASLAGVVLGQWLKLPAAPMTGAMLASAVLYGGGWVALELPAVPLLLSLWIMGSLTGCRFAGTRWYELITIGRYALLLTAILLLLAAAAAAVLSQLLAIDFLAALLAFAPGGVTEMCLIAVALNIDPTFVAAHQLTRILFILSLAPLLGRLSGRLQTPERADDRPDRPD